MFHVEPDEESEDDEPEQPHGEPEPPGAAVDVAAPLALAQDLVRAAICKAIQDPAFRQIFESPQTVASKWPVQI